MGGWKLEVGKMFIYMAFPVGLFHWFNQPEYFEEYVINTKKNSFHPPQEKENQALLQQCIAEHRKKEEMKLLKALEASKGN